MAMFFEIPLIDDFLDPGAYRLILDAIGALSLCNKFCPVPSALGWRLED